MARRGLIAATIGAALLGAAGVGYWAALGDGPTGGDSSAADLTEPPVASGPRADGRPNIVMVIACTLRRDQLSPYGGIPEASPFLDQLAQGGTRFADAIDAAPWTKAASTAIMTGYHPVQVGMIEPATTPNRRRLAPEVTTLAEHLQAAGYETLGQTANPNTNGLFGFDQGFDTYDEVARLWGRSKVRKPSTLLLADRMLEAIDARQRPDDPLYARMMVIDTHEPIKVRKRDARPFVTDDVPMRIGAYRSKVRELDDGLKQLWAGLNTRGFTEDNTVFVLVNDHGEGLNFPIEHGHGHGNHLQPSTVAMPWILYGAGIAPGHVVQGMASQVDVLPTLVGLAGGALDAYDGPGEDWSALVRGEGERTTRTAAYSDTWFQRASRSAVYSEGVACLHDFTNVAEEVGRERLAPRTACYDRAADPLHRSPLEPEAVRVDALMAWRAEQVTAFEAWPHHLDIRVPDDIADQLEALGYAQSDEEAADKP